MLLTVNLLTGFQVYWCVVNLAQTYAMGIYVHWNSIKALKDIFFAAQWQPSNPIITRGNHGPTIYMSFPSESPILWWKSSIPLVTVTMTVWWWFSTATFPVMQITTKESPLKSGRTHVKAWSGYSFYIEIANYSHSQICSSVVCMVSKIIDLITMQLRFSKWKICFNALCNGQPGNRMGWCIIDTIFTMGYRFFEQTTLSGYYFRNEIWYSKWSNNGK